MGAWWLNDLRHVEEELVKTQSGDEYIFQFITAVSHHAQCRIIDASNKEEISHFAIGLPATPPVRVLIDSPRLRCYDVSDSSIIYQVNNKFDGIDREKVKYVDPQIKPELVVVGRALTAKKEWKWIKVFGEFLVKSKDEETILLLERSAQGQFSNEELEINKNSGITEKDIQDVSRRILSQKHL